MGTSKWYHYIAPIGMLVALTSVYIGYHFYVADDNQKMAEQVELRQVEMSRSKQFIARVIEKCDFNGNGTLEEGPEVEATTEAIFSLQSR